VEYEFRVLLNKLFAQKDTLRLNIFEKAIV
jgi:hypothetical protein